VECAACVMHLGLRRGSGRFCWGSPRRGAALARRRAGLYGLGCTTATLAGLKGRWGRGGPHRGLKQAGDDAQHGVVGEVGGGRGRSSRMNCCRATPGLRVRRGGPRGHCKGAAGFRAAGAPVAARNWDGGRLPAALLRVDSGASGAGIETGWPRGWSWTRAKLSRQLAVTGARWCGGTAAAQRLGTAEQGERALLGFWGGGGGGMRRCRGCGAI